MIHDCVMTARYVVILDLPVTLLMGTLVAGHALPCARNPRHRARVGLMPRDGRAADIIWCEVDPAYVCHVANAFDRPDGRVALDVCAYPTMFAGTPGGPDARSRGLERWTVDPAARSVAVRTIDPAPQEFPRVDERRFGQPYRCAYAMALGDDDAFRSEGRLYKHDLAAGTREVHAFGPDRHPGEFVFVPGLWRGGRGRGLDDRPGSERGGRHDRARHPRRGGLRRPAGRARQAPAPRAARLSRQLDRRGRCPASTVALSATGEAPMRLSLDRLAVLALEASVNFALPLAIYDRVAPWRGEMAGLLASSVPPLVWSLGGFVRRRRVDALSVLVLAGIALSLLAMLGGGSARFLQLRENLVTALVGLVFLGSAVIRRPLIFQLARAGLARKSPDEVAAFEAKRDIPRFRRVMTLMTLVWGFGLLASAALACALVLTLSVHDYLLVSPVVSYGSYGALTLWTIWYRRLAQRRAAAGIDNAADGRR